MERKPSAGADTIIAMSTLSNLSLANEQEDMENANRIKQANATTKAFEFVLKYFGIDQATFPVTSPKEIDTYLMQFMRQYGICPYTTIHYPVDQNFVKHTIILDNLKARIKKYAENPHKYYKSAKRARKLQKELVDIRVVVLVCPAHFIKLFNVYNGYESLVKCAQLLMVPLTERKFKNKSLQDIGAFVALIKVLSMNTIWREDFLKSQALKPVLSSLFYLGFAHHTCTVNELLLVSPTKNLNECIIPSNCNQSHKIPSLKIRREIISVFVNVITYGGTLNNGWLAILSLLAEKVSNKLYFELLFEEFKVSSRELWRLWKGLTERARLLFLEVEMNYLRFDSVWRYSPIYKVKCDEMEDYAV